MPMAMRARIAPQCGANIALLVLAFGILALLWSFILMVTLFLLYRNFIAGSK
jgi:hypothetical protein